MDGCPTHQVEWKTVPAGVSKKPPYKAYGAFQVCPVKDCPQKPAKVALDASDPLDKVLMQQERTEAFKRDDNRSYRIERQHSQEMALRYIVAKGKTEFKWDEMVEVIDKFMSDLDKKITRTEVEEVMEEWDGA